MSVSTFINIDGSILDCSGVWPAGCQAKLILYINPHGNHSDGRALWATEPPLSWRFGEAYSRDSGSFQGVFSLAVLENVLRMQRQRTSSQGTFRGVRGAGKLTSTGASKISGGTVHRTFILSGPSDPVVHFWGYVRRPGWTPPPHPRSVAGNSQLDSTGYQTSVFWARKTARLWRFGWLYCWSQVDCIYHDQVMCWEG